MSSVHPSQPASTPAPEATSPRFTTRFHARSYELDGFGHVNHAVFFNWFEQARFEALARGGVEAAAAAARGWSVHVVHAEADYRREVFQGDAVDVETRVESARSSSMTLAHRALRNGDPEDVCAEGRVVAVWIGPGGRPIRIPAEIRRALGLASP